MSAQVLNLTCPGCGAAVTTADKTCSFCQRPIVVTSFKDLSDITGQDLRKYSAAYAAIEAQSSGTTELALALGIVQLKLGQYPQAEQTIAKVLSNSAGNPDAYFYLSVALLQGKKAFVAPMAKVRDAMMHLDTALTLEARGLFALFQAYLAYDFFERKMLNHSPSFSELLVLSKENGVSVADGVALKDTLLIESFGFPLGEFD